MLQSITNRYIDESIPRTHILHALTDDHLLEFEEICERYLYDVAGAISDDEPLHAQEWWLCYRLRERVTREDAIAWTREHTGTLIPLTSRQTIVVGTIQHHSDGRPYVHFWLERRAREPI
jgi:hypothetical protein